MPVAFNVEARVAEIDQRQLCRGRLARLRAELAKRDYAGALLFDPINIRYATGTRNMLLWTLHAPARYAFVATEGPVLLFELNSTFHVSRDSDVVDEIRPSTPWFYFMAGPRAHEKTVHWASEITALMNEFGGSNKRLAVDRCEPWGAQMLVDAGVRLFDAQEMLEQARMIKTPEEIKCIQISVDVADVGIDLIRSALRPGITENQLWSLLHATNIAHGGEWIECRLLSSGERTNPWFQECSNRVISPGDMVSFDTDMVGPFGYLADLSRSLTCPGEAPTAEQRALYEIAQEQVLSNMALIKPGLSFREFSERSWRVPDRYIDNRYMMMVHGAGMVDEYPTVAYPVDWDSWGYDGLFQENMVVCVESYIGDAGGKEGVKLEQQVLISSSGALPMSRSPFVDAMNPNKTA